MGGSDQSLWRETPAGNRGTPTQRRLMKNEATRKLKKIFVCLSIRPTFCLSIVYPSRLKLLKHQSVTDQSSVRPLFLTSVQGKNLQVLALKHSKKKNPGKESNDVTK